MKNSRSNSLLTLKCELLFQMAEQSHPSLFTLTIGFIPISIKRIVCNLDYKPMSLMKNFHRKLVMSRDHFSNYLKQHANCFKATFHLTISMGGQRATGKIQKNNYHHGAAELL